MPSPSFENGSKPDATPLVGVGLYSLREAAGYTGIPSAQIGRWLFGYQAKGKNHKGLWQPALTGLGEKTLTFHDLLEIRFVQAMRIHGVRLSSIRITAQLARQRLEQTYPFSSPRFQADGRSIFAAVMEEIGDTSLIDLVHRQDAFRRVISSSLYAGIDYDTAGKALRWFPLKRSKAVVLDPARHFGKPILTQSGIATETIAAAFAAEGRNEKRVACLYQIPLSDVEAALRFQSTETGFGWKR